MLLVYNMGKYMRKAKLSGEVAVMEVSHQSTLGVRTRARALAAAAAQDSSRPYLELRSRRLEKLLQPSPACKDTPKPSLSVNPRLRLRKSDHNPSSNSGSMGSVNTKPCLRVAAEEPPDAEVSFGENISVADASDRYDRESTPGSLIRNPEEIQTPGSTNRPTNSATTNRRVQTVHQNIPTAQEMEEFFSGAEQHQQRIFIERYNFDPVDDHPLPGRYEWVKIGN